MNARKTCAMVAACLLLASCQQGFAIIVSSTNSGLRLEFFDRLEVPRTPVTKCVWRVDIINERTQRAVWTLRANERCKFLDAINVDDPPDGFSHAASAEELVPGEVYVVEVIAEDSNAKSNRWTI